MENYKLEKTLEVNPEAKKKKKKKKLGAHQAAKYILIIGLIIIAIPCTFLGFILIQASTGTGKPVNGDRFENALNPEITEAEVTSLQSAISGLSNIENCEVNLINGQVRITVDCKDSLESSEIESITKKVFEQVNSKLPMSSYFTSTASKRMYDLSINVFNFAECESEDMICWNVQKNSQMEKEIYKELTKPNDEELVAELTQKVTE